MANRIQKLINTLRSSYTENSIDPELLGKILELLYNFIEEKGDIYETEETPSSEFGENKSFCFDTAHGILFLKLSDIWIPLFNTGGGNIALAQELGESTEMGMSQKAITDAIKSLNNTVDVVVPLSASLSSSQYIFPIGATANISLNWSYNKEIASQTLNDIDVNASIRAASFPNITSNQNYVLVGKTANDAESITKSIQVNFVAPFYYGNSMSYLTSAIITGMTAVASDSLSINNLSGKTIRWNFNNSKMVIAIPESKTIARILDPNQFDIYPNFTRQIIVINSINYNVYVFNDETDADGNYTIILN